MVLTIDGCEIEAAEGASVLDAALAAGIYMPHICSHPDLEAMGGCGLCMVEVEGEDAPVRACMTEVREGMRVSTTSEKADKLRRLAMELILATHPADCTGCPKYGDCELQSLFQYMGVSPARWRCRGRTVPTDDSNPLITHLFTRCIRCGRCVRACTDLRGVGAIGFHRADDGSMRVAVNGSSLQEAGCRFCGACVEVCPTGSIVDAAGLVQSERSREDNIVPCRSTCPAHVDIPRYLRYIKAGEWEKATAVVREKVPFPETLGAICVHECQTSCKRKHVRGALSICRLKLAAAVRDTGEWKTRVRHEPLTGKRVAVVGAGPGGLTAALYLAEKGHSVVVFDAEERPGGQLRYGIPAYRLPDDVIDREVSTILEIAQGPDPSPRIEVRCNERVTDVAGLLADDYDAVLVASGTHRGSVLPLPGNDYSNVHVSTAFLKAVRKGVPVAMAGKDVVVLGAGNAAFDCARTAVRLGAASVTVACRKAEDQLSSSVEERMEAAEEGVSIIDRCAFLEIVDDGQRNAAGVRVQRIARLTFDENNRAATELEEGTEQVLPADHVVFAVGQVPEDTDEMGFELAGGRYAVVDDGLQTSIPGVFAAGDVVTKTSSVIEAIAQGRAAASAIDRHLGGDGDIEENLVDSEEPSPKLDAAPEEFFRGPVQPECVAAAERSKTFETFERPYAEDAAMCEASRCLQCDLRLGITRSRKWNEA